MSFTLSAHYATIQRDGATTAAYTSVTQDNIVDYINVPNTDVTVNLPLAATAGRGHWVFVVNSDGTCSSPANIIVLRAGADTVNGGLGYTMNVAYATLCLVSDGVSKWTRLQG